MGEPKGKLLEAYEMRQRFDAVFDFYDSFRRSPIPIICGVQGKAIGFGCAMAAICDITISAQDAIFQLPETSHGIMPTMAMSSLIDRVKKNSVKEVILATSASVEGETTSHFILDNIKDKREGKVDSESTVTGRVSLGEGSSINQSNIRGPVIIGENVSVDGSYIGPYSG